MEKNFKNKVEELNIAFQIEDKKNQRLQRKEIEKKKEH